MEQPPVRTLNDVGTRYEHERQLISDLEDAVEFYSSKISGTRYVNPVDVNSLSKFTIALEVLSNLLLARSKTNDPDVSYGFRNMIEDVHKDKEILASMVPYDYKEANQKENDVS